MNRQEKARKRGGYHISAVAERFGVHPQTLRIYERAGLLRPSRSKGNTRLYSDEDIATLEIILNLTRELGVNLAGVEIILNMREKMARMQEETEELFRSLLESLAREGSLRPGNRDKALVLFRQGPKRTRYFRVDQFIHSHMEDL